jgi:hypothetical protein
LGAIDGARNGFVQDATAGIALRLDAALASPIPAGSTVAAEGTLGSYFSLRVITVTAASVTVTGGADLPEPLGASTGAADESLEGLRLQVAGSVTEAPSALADGLGVTIDDGSGPLRLVVAADALDGAAVHTGDRITAIGPLGQRDSSGTGAAGYLVHVIGTGTLTVEEPTPSPRPTPLPSPTPDPTPDPTPVPSSTPAPSPTGTPTPSTPPSAPPSVTPSPSATSTPVPVVTIAAARGHAIGAGVTVSGVVTAPPGRLGTPALIPIDDGSGAIVVRMPADGPRPSLGDRILAAGTLADPYGQLEVRGLTTFLVIGTGAVPAATSVTGVDLGESTEARLVTLAGTVEGRPVKSTSGDLAIVVTTANGSARVLADASAGLSATFVAKGDQVRITGVAGQHASRKGALDGYRVWIRGSGDVARTTSAPTASPGPSSSPADASQPPTARTIAAAILAGSGSVTITATVTAPAALLDATRRRIVVQDASAAVEVLLPAAMTPPGVGRRVRIAGEVGRAYGAPRIRAASLATLGMDPVAALELRAAPTAAVEWRLVRIRGEVVEVHRSGDRWTAELLASGVRTLVVGLPGAGIPSSGLVEGRTATIVGIVRRPYPSATDQRFAIVPRTARDVTLGGPADDASAGRGGASATGNGAGAAAPSGRDPVAGPLDANLVDLPGRVGNQVRVGGLVETTQSDGFRLDDGTAVARVRLVGAATDLAGSIVVGDALNATGRVVRDPTSGEVLVEVDDPGGIVLAGDLGGPDPAADQATAAAASDPAACADPGGVTLGGALSGPALPEVSAIGLILISIASLAVSVLRRRRMQRRLAARIATRLAAITPGPDGAGPTRTRTAHGRSAT